ERKAIIQRARLGESEEKDPLSVGNAFVGERVDHFEQRTMMNGDRFFRMKVRQPAKTETQRPTRLFSFLQMLMRTLQRCDGEAFRRNHSRLAHHLLLVGAVTVQRDEQRRWRRSRMMKIVIEFDFCVE